MWDKVLRPTLVLFLICVLIAAALAGTNALTKEPIAQQEAAQINDKMDQVMPAAEYQTLTDDVAYAAKDASGATVGYVFLTSAKGYGGDVSVMTGINPDGSIARVAIISVADETPGLGQNATNDSFLEQFEQKSGSVQIGRGDGEVDALTGATITSNAVAAAVNEALELYRTVGGGN